MAHAIIRGANGRRHEAEFDGAEITVEKFQIGTLITVWERLMVPGPTLS